MIHCRVYPEENITLIGGTSTKRKNADVKEILLIQTLKVENLLNPATNGKNKKQNQRESLKIMAKINRKNHSTEKFFWKEERREYSEEKNKDSGKPFVKIDLSTIYHIYYFFL